MKTKKEFDKAMDYLDDNDRLVESLRGKELTKEEKATVKKYDRLSKECDKYMRRGGEI